MSAACRPSCLDANAHDGTMRANMDIEHEEVFALEHHRRS
ncbi:Hypothetical protein A7982_11429 [Minicystis rosea]|nr:Hypothetical protein A7982_11429 [Minicystis rosea]